MAYEIFGSDITELKAEPAKKHTVMESNDKKPSSDRLEGRNSVMEAIKAGRTIDKVYIQDGIRDGAISSILSKLKGTGTSVSFVKKQRLDMMSETGHHQGIIAQTTAYEYAEIDDIFELAKKKGEPPFIIILDEIEDPHNLGAIIRTAECAGAHGVVIPKRRSASLTQTVALSAAGAIENMPVVQVTNLARTIEELQEKGVWVGAADMDGETYYEANLTGPIAIVIGNEGKGVGRLVKEKCDMETINTDREGQKCIYLKRMMSY